mmetsp:Transcript_29510/g.35091  ORF Transcript_29510/g.35091 Transcript_29510/m.35091 type:complete len:105 (+) Transcript_29510:63-377(+)
MYFGTVVGGGVVSRVFVARVESADGVLEGGVGEWFSVFGASCDGYGCVAVGHLGVGLGDFVCEEWEFDGYHFDSCYVEFEGVFGKLVGSLIVNNRDCLIDGLTD